MTNINKIIISSLCLIVSNIFSAAPAASSEHERLKKEISKTMPPELAGITSAYADIEPDLAKQLGVEVPLYIEVEGVKKLRQPAKILGLSNGDSLLMDVASAYRDKFNSTIRAFNKYQKELQDIYKQAQKQLDELREQRYAQAQEKASAAGGRSLEEPLVVDYSIPEE